MLLNPTMRLMSVIELAFCTISFSGLGALSEPIPWHVVQAEA
jgi:hypothetical protein